MNIQTDFSLLDYNSMHIEVLANQLIRISSVEQLQQLLKTNSYQKPLYILGGGSNVVFTENWPGTVFLMEILGKEVIQVDDDFVWVKANAGENWHEFVLWTLQNDFGGLENLSLIPGKVGASPMQNIGAYGVEIKDVFESLEAIEIATGNLRTFTKEECNFGYRESVFKRELKGKYIISSVVFKLTKRNHSLHLDYGAIKSQLTEMNIEHPTIQQVSNAVIAIRQSKLPNPKEIPNCGSFFKNPTILNEKFKEIQLNYPEIPGYVIDENNTKVPAGWLIEKAGWKGFRNQKVGVHDKQALVLINHNQGSGRDIYELSSKIIEDIQQKFGIELEREVNVI